jgi:hypothetical protein
VPHPRSGENIPPPSLAPWPGHFAERRKTQSNTHLRDPSSAKKDRARLATWTLRFGIIFRAEVQALASERERCYSCSPQKYAQGSSSLSKERQHGAAAFRPRLNWLHLNHANPRPGRILPNGENTRNMHGTVKEKQLNCPTPVRRCLLWPERGRIRIRRRPRQWLVKHKMRGSPWAATGTVPCTIRWVSFDCSGGLPHLIDIVLNGGARFGSSCLRPGGAAVGSQGR